MKEELDNQVDNLEDFYDHVENAGDIKTEKEFEEKKEFIEENLWAKLEKVGSKISFAKDLRALYRYLMDPNVAWYRKSIVVGALIYFIVPIDLVPDIAPLVGYLDDLGVITAVIKYLGHELVPYYD